jgi:RimJ/RimL family protein N-acetyltransferase
VTGATFIEGETLDLRTIERDDLEKLQEMGNHPELRKYSPGARPVNMLKQEEYFEEFLSAEDNVFLMIEHREESVGWVNLKHIKEESRKAEFGIRILPEHQGKGLGSEASELIIEYGFETLNLHRIYARTFNFNSASKALMEKIGFRREGTKRKAVFKDGEYRDVALYSVLEDEN